MTTPLHAVPTIAVQHVVEDPAERDAIQIQALSEGVVVTGETVECLGENYLIGSKVGLMPLMRFAHSAKAGVDSGDLEGLSAMYDMLRDCIAPEDWDRFENDMTRKQAGDEELMPIVGKVIEMLTARPTRRASASSSGPSPTSAHSTAGSSPQQVQGRRVPAGADELIPVADLGRVLAASAS